MFCPETYQIIEAHEPVASNALLDTSNAVKMANCKGIGILIHEDFAVDANHLVLTVHEGATAAEAEAGTHAIAAGAEFPIWVNLAAQTTDTWTRQTDGITYTINGAAGDNAMVFFYIPASILTPGRDWIHLGAAAGDAGNIVSAVYILDGMRYQQAAPLAATT
jgi:hypothetical protein